MNLHHRLEGAQKLGYKRLLLNTEHPTREQTLVDPLLFRLSAGIPIKVQRKSPNTLSIVGSCWVGNIDSTEGASICKVHDSSHVPKSRIVSKHPGGGSKSMETVLAVAGMAASKEGVAACRSEVAQQ